ncbi:972_t:CDS:2, partial [Gigaspora margarita]
MLIKAESNGTLASYYRDHKNEVSAFKEHAEIIENDQPMVLFYQLRSVAKSKNDQLSYFFNEIEAMACLNKKYSHTALEFKNKVVENDNNLTWLRSEMVAKNFRLSNFFDLMYNAALPKNRSSKYLDKLDKKLAIECYIICSNQNSKLTAFKKDISLFVDLIGVSTEAIDALLHTGIMISRRHLDKEKTAITDYNLYKITSYLE